MSFRVFFSIHKYRQIIVQFPIKVSGITNSGIICVLFQLRFYTIFKCGKQLKFRRHIVARCRTSTALFGRRLHNFKIYPLARKRMVLQSSTIKKNIYYCRWWKFLWLLLHLCFANLGKLYLLFHISIRFSTNLNKSKL